MRPANSGGTLTPTSIAGVGVCGVSSFHRARTERERYAVERDQVFHRDRQTLQRPQRPSLHDLALGLTRGRKRELGRHGDKSVHGGLRAGDALERGFDQLDRRDLASAYELEELQSGFVEKLAHVVIPAPCRNPGRTPFGWIPASRWDDEDRSLAFRPGSQPGAGMTKTAHLRFARDPSLALG